MRNLRFEKFAAFCKEFGEERFSTRELCAEYMRLKREWWGSNLVCVGAEEREGYWFPMFNVWD